MTVDRKSKSGTSETSILSSDALTFLDELHQRFESRRRELLAMRAHRQRLIDDGTFPDFAERTRRVREGDWQVTPPPADLLDRRVEITGPTDRKMVINALNSGAKVFMADFEDANTPSWENMTDGQVNLFDAIRRDISLEESGKTYELGPDTATLVVRPRGWHLTQSRSRLGAEPMSAGLFDAGLYLFHNARELLSRGSGPYFYLPKLESAEEARLWNDVFVFAQERLGTPRGSIRATVLIETITAAFEMEEILYELRDHSSGLNAGRWDYIFSIIKKFRAHPQFVLPDRAKVTMSTPFMASYTEALVRACHRRGTAAIGGMSAFIPSRRDPAINQKAIPAIEADKRREGNQGFDGAWVAHPDLVPVVREVFDQILGGRPNQIDRLREDVTVSPFDLLDVSSLDERVTEEGLRSNIAVGMLYLNSWLNGRGAAALFDQMEDTATAEISRSQVWQWIRHATRVPGGPVIDRTVVEGLIDEETENARRILLESGAAVDLLAEARSLFEEVALGEEFVDFLTLPGQRYLGS